MAADYRVPLMEKPPTIDGKAEPAEWASAVGFDGFAFNGTLDRRRVRAWVGATKSHLYFAIQSQLPDEGQLVAEVAMDTVKLVFDDSIEVWIDPTPGSEHGQVFQLLANAAGRTAYKHHGRGNVPEDPTWQGNWRVANGFHAGHWHCEVEVPIANLPQVPNLREVEREATQGQWGINLCRNWKNPWAFSSTGGGAYAPSDRFTFVGGVSSRRDTRDEDIPPTAPAVAHESRADAFVGDINHVLILTNRTAAPIPIKATLALKRDVMPELINSEIITLAPGDRKELAIKAKDDSTRKFELTLSVASPDGKTAYYQRTVAWQKGEPWRWTTKKKEVLPIDFQFAYYPYSNKMRVLADVSNLPQDARLEKLTCTIRPKGRKRAVKTVTFDAFKDGRQELEFALPHLDGEYEIAVTAHGRNVPKGELVKEFERTVYEWERKGLGTSTKVYPPFTPIKVEGKKVSTVLREHTMNDFGLWDQVVAAQKPLLAAPMRYVAGIAGDLLKEEQRGIRFAEAAAHRAVTRAVFQIGALEAEATSTWNYDGLMRVDLKLSSAAGQPLDHFDLHIPLKASAAPMIHVIGDGIRNTIYARVPEGEGVVWDSTKVQVNDFPKGFCSYIYVGSPVRGLSWFCENDRGWSWDPAKPNLDLVRKGEQLILRIHFVNKPTIIKEPRTITFGLQAAPVKPRIGNWRYAWHREKYTLLGTDINWLALGDCGSVYPAGKDMVLWEAIARGNKEKLSDEEVNKVIEHGRKYFEPYGEDKVKSYIAHVRHNLRSRYGSKMVYYYNRASYQLADEFQTFQDEWGLSDYRTVGKGNGIGEIKIVPSPSYIDHALYWYGKSFDIGGNQGVYWDNYFFVGSYNTAMTDAYRREDGSVMPSNGLWGLRELVKRSFVYMNERGMRPITMPHMTSTNILPLYSFATVQYDWEWKYSEGDVQYRFPREYILLVSTGELAGVWPVLLGDHGKLANDPWTQRTFAAVCLVHELDGWGRQDVWEPLFEHVHRLVETPGLEVYRYWDDRPQPVAADSPDLPTIVYSLKGKEAVFAVVSYAEKDLDATITIDPKALGFEGGYKLLDAETDKPVTIEGNKLKLTIKKHDVREFRMLPQ